MKRLLILAITIPLLQTTASAYNLSWWPNLNNPLERAAKRACRAICKDPEAMGYCQHCIEDYIACEVTVNSKVPMLTAPGQPYKNFDGSIAMSVPGEKYLVTGASDLELLCQHGGLCIPASAVRFDKPCSYKTGRGWEKTQ